MLGLGLGLAAWLGLLLDGQPHRAAAAAQARGLALFVGDVDLDGRVVGHDLALPALASRCSNCHGGGAVAAAAGAAEGAAPTSASALNAARSVAAELNRASLGQARSRRGGPPSAYDANRLCLLLRSGRDAADVIVSTTMPRYAPSDAQCADLWAYLHAR